VSQVLIAVEHRQCAHVVSVHSNYDAALGAWYAADDARIAAGTPMRELFYAVRDDSDQSDPTVALLHQPEAEAKPPRRQTRTVPGTDIKLINQGDGRWVSEDDKYMVERVDDYETECDDAHPVKIGRHLRNMFNEAVKDGTDHLWNRDLHAAIVAGRKGYRCEGGEVHFYSMWEASADNELVSRDDTFSDALRYLGRHIETGRIYV
jgi:hypothetical protein